MFPSLCLCTGLFWLRSVCSAKCDTRSTRNREEEGGKSWWRRGEGKRVELCEKTALRHALECVFCSRHKRTGSWKKEFIIRTCSKTLFSLFHLHLLIRSEIDASVLISSHQFSSCIICSLMDMRWTGYSIVCCDELTSDVQLFVSPSFPFFSNIFPSHRHKSFLMLLSVSVSCCFGLGVETTIARTYGHI